MRADADKRGTFTLHTENRYADFDLFGMDSKGSATKRSFLFHPIILSFPHLIVINIAIYV